MMIRNLRSSALALTVLGASNLLAVSAQADVLVSFFEGAPKDRFVFENVGACAIEGATVDLDLSQSLAGLVFDTTSTGAGVEVFQPFELVEGADRLSAVPVVSDGDTRIVLEIDRLDPNQRIAFTIDVDDTLGGREITVSNAEIENAVVVYSDAGQSTEAPFTNRAKSMVELEDC